MSRIFSHFLFHNEATTFWLFTTLIAIPVVVAVVVAVVAVVVVVVAVLS